MGREGSNHKDSPVADSLGVLSQTRVKSYNQCTEISPFHTASPFAVQHRSLMGGEEKKSTRKHME